MHCSPHVSLENRSQNTASDFTVQRAIFNPLIFRDMDDRWERWPPDRHMPSSVSIATCMVNTLVTFQVNKFQSHISLYGFPFSSLNKKIYYRGQRTKQESSVNLTDQNIMLSNDIKSKENQYKRSTL